MMRTAAPWRALRSMGTGHSDYLTPLATEPRGLELADHLCQSNVDLLDLHQVPEQNPLAIAMEDGAVQAACPVLTLPQTFEEYTKTLSKSLRYDVSKAMRSNPDIQVASTPEEAHEHLAIFFDLHGRRWRKRGMPGAFSLPRARKFHRRFVVRAVESGMLHLAVLRHEGRPVGTLYGLRAGRSMFFYQSGFDPEAKGLNPGTTLIAHTIRCAIDQGCTEFNFLRGDEPYKLRWKPQIVVPNVRILRRLNRVRGEMGRRMNSWEARVELSLRRRLEGKGLLR